ncbi:hypothetical protein [Microbacterium indicum]|uniref:hypothetical protein n=1 Tax=Microbacterium indicum TaxID=358100 RepID=UPI00055DFCAD|nr:hypothetical protein [Microbacterium indicum]
MRDGRWDHLFDDLEHQFAAEIDAAEHELAAETERVRVAMTSLAERLAARGVGAPVAIEIAGGEALRGAVLAVGSDWIALAPEGGSGLDIVPLHAVRGISLAGAAAGADPLTARMRFGFVLRSLARRRTAVAVARPGTGDLQGTPALVGSDHLDIAVHDAGSAPRASEVARVVTVPFAAISRVRVDNRADAEV